MLPNSLQDTLEREFGKRHLASAPIPEHITDGLKSPLRPYQETGLQYFLNYWNEPFEGKLKQNHHLLFHMATGSGKTMMMAAIMLHLYKQGYRNFLFFVNSTNIINKTRDNFLNTLSPKYLFQEPLKIGEKPIVVQAVDSFQYSNPNAINIVFSTVQGLHANINTPRENALSIDDFMGGKTVLIADEAHHINADTKKPSNTELLELVSWEQTVGQIFNAHPENALLEFTATIDFSKKELMDKYLPKLIYDYPLKQFRLDGYSKEVTVLQSDLPPFERALQAILLSQYRLKLFEQHGHAVKPVVLLKSKTIKDNKAFFEEFTAKIASLNITDIEAVAAKHTDNTIAAMFADYAANNTDLNNLIKELQYDFAADRLLLVDSNNITPQTQLELNSLESPDNGYRAVFAVDMLNEGWDVLNLFDIVRLYDTRDKGGATTTREAQLIGRGARYCPFVLDNIEQKYQRKFDKDTAHPLRLGETLFYHSAHNPKYVQELTQVLVKTGIFDDKTIQQDLSLKDSFKKTDLYKFGFVLKNERITNTGDNSAAMLHQNLNSTPFSVALHTGQSNQANAFTDSSGNPIKAKRFDCTLGDLGEAILQKAIQTVSYFTFDTIKTHFNSVNTAQEFTATALYPIKVEIKAVAGSVQDLSSKQKLTVAIETLENIAVFLRQTISEHIGSPEFKPFMVKEIFKDKVLNFTPTDGDGENGKSMIESLNADYHLDLQNHDWYAFNDCYGTSEEKLLIKYIEKHYDALKTKYSDVYLLRNERHFQIYNFTNGKPIEPDFVLFLKNNVGGKDKHYQIFIEPKGGHLLKQDVWKETFLLSLKAQAKVDNLGENKDFTIWGMPFYNRAERINEFNAAFQPILGTA